MRRIRIAFVLLALALALAGGLLVQRALQAVALEREARREAVAERVFDEMERALSRVLAEEEARPHLAYEFYFTPEGVPETVRLRSPLSHVPSLPFVVGHFQIDGDGSVHTPLLPRDPGEASERGDYPLPQDQEERARRVVTLAEAFAADRRPALTFPIPPPGETWSIGGQRAKMEATASGVADDASAEEGLPEAEPARELEAYEVLQSLNRGAADREQRERKVYKSKSSGAVVATAEAAAPRAPAERDEPRLAARHQAAPPAPPVAEVLDLDAVPLIRSQDEPTGPVERVAVDPLMGRLAPGGALLLTRTVLIGDRGLRQGLVIEPERLEAELRATLPRGVPVVAFELVGPEDLAAGRNSEVAAADAPSADAASVDPLPTHAASADAYRHRFAEPFDPIAAELQLGPLASGPGSLAVTALASLFVLASSLGLFALYRMTTVTVEFAERRGNFVAAVSHELKTPLTAIRMYAEMLRDGLVPSEAKQREYYTSITTESERLSRLINNVLEFSRLEKGTRSMDLRVGDVRPVVEEAVLLLGPHAERHGQRLELDAPEGLPTVRFERDALLQVLFNLVDNAVKYAKDAREPVIHVSLAPVAGGVELRVRDHGPGVPVGQERRILEPFHRAEDELTRRTQGTGIGLALVRGLVEEMGAAFDVGSAEGGGFEARIQLAPA